MNFPILQQYEKRFPDCVDILQSLPTLFNKRLWNELTIACLQLVYHPSVKGKIGFEFYTEFLKRFQKNIDQINLLKLIREVLISLPYGQILSFLQAFKKEANADDVKILLDAFRGFFSIPNNMSFASEMLGQVKTFVEGHKDVDNYIFSAYYLLSYTYYGCKGKYKQFYSSALQYLVYTNPEEIEEKERLNLLFDMAVAVLVSDQIYNFSQLLEQPLLIELKNSQHAWLYELIEIFNKGEIQKFAKANIKNEVLGKNSKNLEQKIRLMAFLELAFNLPKSNRVITFDKLSKICGIPIDHVEFMVMKAMALELVKGSIDQIRGEVTIGWVAPKVLQTERIVTMLGKFQEWENGVKEVEGLMAQIKV